MTTEIVPTDRIQQALAKENITNTVLDGLKVHMSIKVIGPEDKENYKLAHDARIFCKNLRVLATKIAKVGREDARKEAQAWIDEEKRVVGEITKVEEYLEGQERIVDEAKERAEAEAKAKAETERLEAEKKVRDRLMARANALMAVGVVKSLDELAVMPDSDFDALLTEAKVKHAEAQEQKNKEDEAREVESKRLADQKAEQDKKDEAQRAEQKRLDDAKHAQEIEDAKKKAAEDARIEAEAKAKREAEEKAETERKTKAEEARLAALAPDKEKLKKLASDIQAVNWPEMQTADGSKMLAEATTLISRAVEILTK